MIQSMTGTVIIFIFAGTGYYSASDYQTILKVASANHIEVIPEIDIPGHSHAAIRAMETR